MKIIKVISEWKKKAKSGDKLVMAIVEIDGQKMTRHITREALSKPNN